MLFLKVVMVVSKSQYAWVKNGDAPMGPHGCDLFPTTTVICDILFSVLAAQVRCGCLAGTGEKSRPGESGILR